MTILLVGAGGFCGAFLRYMCSIYLAKYGPASTFPWVILCINCMGAGLLGAFSTMALTDSLSALLFTGCLGAFTTFSTFSVEAAQLWERRAYRQLGLYVILTLAGCPLLFGMGFMLMNAF